MKNIQSIMFVCLGNICRSPLAEAIARHKIEKLGLGIKVASSGTAGYHQGEMACDQSIGIAEKHGIDLSAHRAQKITKQHLKEFDLIVALDESNYNDLKHRVENANKVLVKLGDFGFDGGDVPDPYYTRNIHPVYDMIERCVSELLSEVAN